MGDSLNQPRLKRTLLPTSKIVCQVSSSKGSDGHTLALTTNGEVFSWGDGKICFLLVRMRRFAWYYYELLYGLTELLLDFLGAVMRFTKMSLAGRLQIHYLLKMLSSLTNKEI